jgi:hypothetical protein
VEQEHRPVEVADRRYYTPTGRGADVDTEPGTADPRSP